MTTSSLTLERDSGAAIDLDLIRGLAALTVLVTHLRTLFFAPFEDIAHPDLLTKAFYTLTPFGHQAVIVFFVLSGFLVGSGVVQSINTDKWSWATYATNRGVRLLIVLFPALALGLLLDRLGQTISGPQGIYGAPYADLLYSKNGMVPIDVQHRNTWQILLGNLTFSQTILVPPLGSNGALWSLANEFWYYVIFPMFCLASKRRTRPWPRLGLIGAALLLLIYVGSEISGLFFVWLMGASLAFIKRRPWNAHFLSFIISLLIFIFSAIASRFRLLPPGLAADLILGMAFSLFLICILRGDRPTPGKARTAFSRNLSAISYTMYLTHVPVMFLIHSIAIGEGSLWVPTVSTMANGILVVFTVLLTTISLWYLFESRTDVVRAWLKRRLSM